MGIRLSEHKSFTVSRITEGEEILDNDLLFLKLSEPSYELFKDVKSKPYNSNGNSYAVKEEAGFYSIKADYYVGLDWLGNTGRTVCVEPKINPGLTEYFNDCLESDENSSEEYTADYRVEQVEVNYLDLLLQIMSLPKTAEASEGVIRIDWEAKYIRIDRKDDRLTPFLIVQFLQVLKAIVRKGLKKSYYKVRANLNNRAKGKILVGEHIRQNVFKSRFTSTFCEFQVFGADHIENRFLKKVLQFAVSYIENNEFLFSSNIDSVKNIVSYCRPAFELIGEDIEEKYLKNINLNPFFNEYKEALRIGQFILKRFSYNITKTAQQKTETPPFWIDMPQLFELYFYYQLLKANPSDEKYIHYQFSTYGNSLDILISKPGFEMIIDAKYKLKYNKSHIHQDIRQVSGYARLKKVIHQIKADNPEWEENKTIDCLIIYPELKMPSEQPHESPGKFSLENIKKQFRNPENQIMAYDKVFKLGISLPVL
ncbi:5-methylcytosine restriction system specificity protein McrC [Chryseobacterium populi]|uniref:McrBC 5-methylcytosine restriction system component n=1 Tax=Chryseobacterium populi TaxID=1144316 RepID=J2TB52_9FLAO|nr:McrBC 5-methylcytosine restriction system component [Chryseobacterium populi]EJL75382.1 McrBC 5-methylcytosine restriction system component [Chryseobacterium populi]